MMGTLLRAGVLAAAAIVIAGGIWHFAAHGTAGRHYRVFRGEPAELRSVGGIVGGALSGDDTSVIGFGLLLLIATPVARVAFAILAFAWQRDWTFVVISAVVLGVLLYSLV